MAKQVTVNKTLQKHFDRFLRKYNTIDFQSRDSEECNQELVEEFSDVLTFFRTGETDFRNFVLLPQDIVLSLEDDPNDMFYWTPDGKNLQGIRMYSPRVNESVEDEDFDEEEGESGDITWRDFLTTFAYLERYEKSIIIVIRLKKQSGIIKKFKDFHE
jgi:hypothetical protein